LLGAGLAVTGVGGVALACSSGNPLLCALALEAGPGFVVGGYYVGRAGVTELEEIFGKGERMQVTVRKSLGNWLVVGLPILLLVGLLAVVGLHLGWRLSWTQLALPFALFVGLQVGTFVGMFWAGQRARNRNDFRRTSDAVGKLLANDWGQLNRLLALTKTDKGFQRFVVKHIDETLPGDTLLRISSNVRYSCPAGAQRFCSLIASAASGKSPAAGSDSPQVK
jgi:hypothetical protein